jgi:subtilisin family serine protease
MSSTIARVMALPCALVLILASAGADAQNIFRKSTSTESGYNTWNDDAIDIENVSETGHGVYVAVLDTGLAPNYRDYFPSARIAADLGKGFYQNVSFKARNDKCGHGVNVGPLIETSFIGSTGSEHGTHVTSTVIGFNYKANFDAASGFDIPPIQVRGIAPNATVIPVKVLADYRVPALPDCPDGAQPAQNVVFGTSEMVAAGIDYVTDLAIAGHRPMVINMSLGGPTLEPVEQAAMDRAIANGVIIVASAGNSGTDGMGYPGGYAPVISVAALGWQNEFVDPAVTQIYRMYWLQNGNEFVPPLFAGGGDVAEPTPTANLFPFDGSVYVVNFSSRELAGQELDVAAPGVLIRGPFAGFPGFTHLPWWAKGIGDLVSGTNPGNFFYVSGTSMASPHVAAVAALMLERDPSLTQAEIESILKSTTIPIAPGAGFSVITGTNAWGADATGTGLIQADEAINAIP